MFAKEVYFNTERVDNRTAIQMGRKKGIGKNADRNTTWGKRRGGRLPKGLSHQQTPGDRVEHSRMRPSFLPTVLKNPKLDGSR